MAPDMTLPHSYRMLFEEDREFNQGPFAEALRDQYIEERNDWLADLQSSIHEILAAADPENAKLDSSSLDMLQLTAADFKRAILSFDYGKTEKEVDKYVCLWDEWQLNARRNAGAVARTCSWSLCFRYVARGFAMEGKSMDLSMQANIIPHYKDLHTSMTQMLF